MRKISGTLSIPLLSGLSLGYQASSQTSEAPIGAVMPSSNLKNNAQPEAHQSHQDSGSCHPWLCPKCKAPGRHSHRHSYPRLLFSTESVSSQPTPPRLRLSKRMFFPLPQITHPVSLPTMKLSHSEPGPGKPAQYHRPPPYCISTFVSSLAAGSSMLASLRSLY